MDSSLKAFGQEFYPHEAIRALKFADKTRITDRRALVEYIANSLPQSGEMTRLRVAAKLVQRYLTFTRSEIVPPPQSQPFARLVSRSRHTPTQIELLFWRLAHIDKIVGIMARELFYPVCLALRPPEGVSTEAFAARNGARLFETEPLLTRSFILAYVRDRWNFTNHSTIDRSLRVLQNAGFIARERQNELRGHPTAFRVSAHDVSLTTFLFALYEEFLPHVEDPDFSLTPAVLPVTDCARTLLLSRAQVEAHLHKARAHQLLAQHGPHLRLVCGDLDTLVSTLLTKAI
jgi:hypothetical protein